jgi:asparagine synthase (glutamine-hydrolysing)
MLSGGLDSSAIAALGSAHRTALPAYSVVFPDRPAVDESRRIASVREWVGLPSVEAAFVEASPLAAGIEFIREWGLPSVTPNLFIWLPLLRRAAADGVDVMLDGEGGDELFGCATYLVADALRAGRPLRALRTARRLPGVGDSPRARVLRRALLRYGLRPAVPYALHEPLRRALDRRVLPDWLGDEARRDQRTGDDPWAWKRTRAPRWWAQLAHSLVERPDAMGVADQLRREAALGGVELRHPLRDPELIELALALPPELAFDPHLDRALARRALQGALPPEVLEDDRKPVFNPVLEAPLAGRDRETLRALLAEPHPELARRVRVTAAAALLEPAGGPRPPAWGLEVWRLASLELWLEHQEDEAALERRAERLDPTARVSFTEVTVRS